jgi:cyclic beta-1,2-glucan synthetase
MIPTTFDHSPETDSDSFEPGRHAAGHVTNLRPRGRAFARLVPDRRQVEAIVRRAHRVREEERVIRTAAKEARDLARSLKQHPIVRTEEGEETPRTCAVAREYLASTGGHFSEAGLIAFVNGYQEVSELEMGEVWALKPALQAALLHELATAGPKDWPNLISALRQIGEATWKDLFESVSIVDRILGRDPARAYSMMDYESRDRYRRTLASLARYSRCTEHEVAERALGLAMQAAAADVGDSRAAIRRTHVGYYLIDDGLGLLRAAIGYRRTLDDRTADWILRNPNLFYLAGIELLTFVIVVTLLGGLGNLTPIFAALVFLLVPATQAAVDFMNHLVAFLIPPRTLPKLDFSEGIPTEFTTMVAVPTLLLNEEQVRDLALDLEIRYLANRDPNLLFALLTDSPDSDRPIDERDTLVATASNLIETLNRRYSADGRSPFYLFHRNRIYNPSESRWMGWERKRGKLLDFNRYLRGGFDSFPVKIGDLTALARVKYIITLDSDTRLPRDAAAKLIGAMAHPLNRAVLHPRTKMVVEGYGILQPRIGISIQSASRSRLAALYSGQTGFDIYTRASSDVYQDLFGEGIFTGKGIYEVDALRESLEWRFPDNALLSHDLIEGAYARAALVSDIELIDDYPSHFSAYSRRKHRWVRGDWQIMRWLESRVPDRQNRTVINPISLISRWKILDNLRRSLIESAMLLLFIGGWLYLPAPAWYWTAAGIATLFLPVYWQVFFALLRMPTGGTALSAWLKDTITTFVRGHFVALLSLVFLLHQSLLSLDAIVRSVLRVFVTKRKLLEWETAAESETAAKRKATVDTYLEWTPVLSLLTALVVWVVRPASMTAAAPVIALWFCSSIISRWLNRAPRTSNRDIPSGDLVLLRDSAERICRYFSDWSNAATNWLIPDNVRDDGTAAMRLSPTNLGMLLNARIAAVHFGTLSIEEFVFATQKTLDVVDRLPKYAGHLFNWYDVETLAPLEPRFVSTVDSGNLVACLWTLKQAALAFAANCSTLAAPLHAIAETCDRLASATDFRCVYVRRKKVLSVGFNVTENHLESSTYDLMASESRIASFVAIAKGDIPQQAWFHLGRRHTMVRGERVLASWTGTMFEYLMPMLWMRTYPGTIMEESGKAVVRIQREYGRRKGVAWGISESGCTGDECGYGYAAFGIPELAMKQIDPNALVVSPYSSFLALMVDPAEAIRNLRRMREFDWSGRYGFFEAIDYSKGGGEVVRSWMAHHQGMSLLAACNLLFDCPMQRYFHNEPHVMATELLLHERVPAGVQVEEEEEELEAIAVPA